jgi:hypothetical protein
MITGMQCKLPDVHIDTFHLFIVSSSSLLTVYCSFLKHTSKQKRYIISNFIPGIISHAYLCNKMHYPWQAQCTERITNNSAATVTNINAVTLTEYEVINNNGVKFLALMGRLLFFYVTEIASVFFDCLFPWNEKSCV